MEKSTKKEKKKSPHGVLRLRKGSRGGPGVTSQSPSSRPASPGPTGPWNILAFPRLGRWPHPLEWPWGALSTGFTWDLLGGMSSLLGTNGGSW